MCQFDHENVIKLYGVVTETPIMIVLEYMSRGDLRSVLLKLQSVLVIKPIIMIYINSCFNTVRMLIHSCQLFC